MPVLAPLNCPRATAAALMACAGSSGIDISGEAKLHMLPMQPNNSQATNKTRSSEGRCPSAENDLSKGGSDGLMELCMIGLTILWLWTV
jgi:hypothetical protein